jgi:predicted neuraminidase
MTERFHRHTSGATASRRYKVVLRSDAGAVYRADSADRGRSWGPALRTTLGNSNSGLDVAAMLGGKLLALAYNPATDNWGARYPLRVSLSADDGVTWSHHVDFETQAPGEYSYPAITPWPEQDGGEDGEVGGGRSKGFTLTYTYNRENVKFVSMGVEEFLRRAEDQQQKRQRQKKGS